MCTLELTPKQRKKFREPELKFKVLGHECECCTGSVVWDDELKKLKCVNCITFYKEENGKIVQDPCVTATGVKIKKAKKKKKKNEHN